jgi:hypothetical protein
MLTYKIDSRSLLRHCKEFLYLQYEIRLTAYAILHKVIVIDFIEFVRRPEPPGHPHGTGFPMLNRLNSIKAVKIDRVNL